MKNKKKNTPKTLDQLRLTFAEADKKLHQASKDLKEVKQFLKKYKAIQKNIKELENYYHSNWLEDRTYFYQNIKNESYLSCSEDAIWNTSQEFYQQKIKLLKKIIKTL